MLSANMSNSAEQFGMALVVWVLCSSVINIWVLVEAFKDSVSQGFLVLVIPFYQLYFVVSVLNNNTLRWLYAITWLLFLLMLMLVPNAAQTDDVFAPPY